MSAVHLCNMWVRTNVQQCNVHVLRQGFESHVLRFCGRLITDDGKVDTRSKFVISYFLSDDTILINQIPDVNAGENGETVICLSQRHCYRSLGIAPGRFLSRRRLPKGRDPDTQEQIYFSAPDLYVGAIVKFNQHTFLLTEADEYVFSFMEKFEEREKVPHASKGSLLEVCLTLLFVIVSSFQREDHYEEA